MNQGLPMPAERPRRRACLSFVSLSVFSLCGLCDSVVQPSFGAEEPWSTYRGNLARTGSTDGKAGPRMPKVLWAMKSKEHFVAAPVPHGGRLLVSGLGFVNIPTFYCLDADPKATKRVLWSKTAPLLKLPTVSSPALAGDRLVFGEGMHQTDGASLYCLRADGGLPLWQREVPGTLVHLEGSPTVAGGKVYVGGGAAGVLCVDLNRVTLDGKEMSAEEAGKRVEAKRAELQKKYEEARKKKDPLAVPPTDDDLPRPVPLLRWQQGKKKWHVDAAVAVAGERVLAASAFLDKEREGERALFCLDAKTGKQRWKAPLAHNPWGGPSVAEGLVVLGGSSVPFDPKLLKGAKGSLAALDLATGKQKWRKDLPGGVLGCVALAGGKALATATDGKVRAYNLKTGALAWFYDARAPLFAPVAVAGDTVYAADLKGVVHAVDLKSGSARWRLDLGKDPAVSSPGMAYGGPVVHGGRVYVATCNLAGEFVNKPTAVVCVGEK
jgi:outer membrane protein assembly factor BamB